MEEQKEQTEDQLLCPLCDEPLEIVLTTPKELGITLMLSGISDNDPVHQGECRKCNLTVPLDY